MSTIKGPIQLKGKTAAELTAENPVLLDRQLCFETDTATEVDNVRYLKVKQGPGAWNDLKYIQIGVPVDGFSGSYNDLSDKPTIPTSADYVSRSSVQRHPTALTTSIPSPNINWNADENGYAKVTLVGSGGFKTINAPTNLKNGYFYTIDITASSSGPVNIAWNSIFSFPHPDAAGISLAFGATTRFTFRYDGTHLQYISGGYGSYRRFQVPIYSTVDSDNSGYEAIVSGNFMGISAVGDYFRGLFINFDVISGKLTLARKEYANVNRIEFEENTDEDDKTVTIPNRSGIVSLKGDDIILTAPDATQYKLVVDNLGNLSTEVL